MYGSIIDSNPPEFIKKFYQTEIPQFVFEGPNPYNKTIRRNAIVRTIFNCALLGIAGYAYYTNIDVTKSILMDAFKEINVSNSAYITPIVELIGLLYLLKILAISLKIFTNKKIWYIALKNELILTDLKKTCRVPWEEICSNPEYTSDFTTNKLILELKQGLNLNESPYRNNLETTELYKISIVDIPNPEIKRLMDNLIAKGNTREEQIEIERLFNEKPLKF